MKKKYIQVGGALFIGLLALNSLSSCTHTRQVLGNDFSLVGPTISPCTVLQSAPENLSPGVLKEQVVHKRNINPTIGPHRGVDYYNNLNDYDRNMQSAKSLIDGLKEEKSKKETSMPKRRFIRSSPNLDNQYCQTCLSLPIEDPLIREICDLCLDQWRWD